MKLKNILNEAIKSLVKNVNIKYNIVTTTHSNDRLNRPDYQEIQQSQIETAVILAINDIAQDVLMGVIKNKPSNNNIYIKSGNLNIIAIVEFLGHSFDIVIKTAMIKPNFYAKNVIKSYTV
jgi:DUF1009 family protein